MELLKEIAHISGKPGLYRILKPTRTGVIVETIDEKKGRTVVGANARVSVLKEISVYSDSEEGSKPLPDIFAAIREKHGEKVEIDAKNASETELREFLGEVFPEFDREKVYPSDIRKMISWYNLLSSYLPEVFEVKEENTEEEKAA
ncbi:MULTISPECIES: DUF5606 family protein [Siphonobacter]|uniref:Uncharacterized protein n=1 Tax=Siphonobacter curvatus TaxID=2094562 RepID=A0A2S7ISS1_9BACT|nr:MULTISPECIES: DUF5606 domain-containing protein [Siphonobacter]PMD99388.1 hypothetical protein BWI97_00060 [Siphonobacter sp. BAB-5405]PQA60763.1 hypothetical protein C5O19_14450 [Siphonobacter curvatus]